MQVAPHETQMTPEAFSNLKQVFERQQERRWDLARSTAQERVARLRRLRDAVVARRGELCAALKADFNKPATETELTELQPLLMEISETLRHLAGWMKPKRVGTPLLLTGTRSEVRWEPKGVVLILSPWNYPFLLSMNPLVAAISAGNAVVMRPSEKVPHTSAFIRSLIQEVFPADEVAVFTGGRDLADALLDLPFDHIFFTGSTAVGRKVMVAAARHLASVTLELGGKSPVIVDETARARDAALRVVWGKFINAGQTCVAPDYVFVHASKADEFVRHAKETLGSFYGATDEARAQSGDFCRIVDQHSTDRLQRTLQAALEQGARLEVGGQVDAANRYVAPTIVSAVTRESPLMDEEIFGPVLPVLTYRDLDEVLAFIRSRGKPLALYVFSQSRGNTERILSGTTAGGTSVNNVVLHLANPNLPFGGVGESGLGNYHGHYGFKTFSHERSVLVQSRLAPVKQFYPPYRPRVRRMVELATKLVS